MTFLLKYSISVFTEQCEWTAAKRHDDRTQYSKDSCGLHSTERSKSQHSVTVSINNYTVRQKSLSIRCENSCGLHSTECTKSQHSVTMSINNHSVGHNSLTQHCKSRCGLLSTECTKSRHCLTENYHCSDIQNCLYIILIKHCKLLSAFLTKYLPRSQANL